MRDKAIRFGKYAAALCVVAGLVLGFRWASNFFNSPLDPVEITKRVSETSQPQCVKDWLSGQLDRRPDLLITDYLIESAILECKNTHRRIERSKIRHEQRAALEPQKTNE